MDDRGLRPGYGRGSRPNESDQYQGRSWTPFQGPGPKSRQGRPCSPDANTVPLGMDLDDRDGYQMGASMAAKRLTAHVAPVPGRSMSPDTTRPGPRRNMEDEDSYLYGNQVKNESRGNWERRPAPGPDYEDYRGAPSDRPRQFKAEQESYKDDSDPMDIFDAKPIRRPAPDPPPFARDTFNDIDAGRQVRPPRFVEPENKNFSRENYPQRNPMPMRPMDGDPKPKVAVYEMSKIPKKVRMDEDEGPEESEEDKIRKLRQEHAKLELRADQLKQLIDRTVEKENDLRRMNKGRGLADNKEFCDNKKLQMDAQKKYEDASRAKREAEVSLNAILNRQRERSQAAADAANENSQDGDSPAVPLLRPPIIVSTDFLEGKREDREEDTQDIPATVEFFDGGDHWCEPCQDVFTDSVAAFLEHLHTDDHWKSIPKNRPVPWPLIRRTKNFDEDRQMAALKGSQFMVPCKGYFCALCKFFCGDKEAAEEHLYSLNHNRTHTRFAITKPEYEVIHNKDKATARAKAQASIRQKKREADEKRKQEEELKLKRETEERRKKEKEARDKIIEESKYMKILNEKKTLSIERIKKDDRGRSREKSIKRKNVSSSSSSSSSSSRDSSPEIMEVKPLDDVKLKKTCVVAIPKEEMIRAKKAYGKMTLAATAASSSTDKKSNDDSPSEELSNSKDVTTPTDDSKSGCSTPAAKDDEEESILKKSKLSAEFDDDDDKDDFNLSSVLPSALLPDDNAVTSPDSAQADKLEQLVSSTENKTSDNKPSSTSPSKASPSKTSPSKKAVASNFDAIRNALENDDEDSSEKNSVKKPIDPQKMTSDDAITGNDVQLQPVEPMETSRNECSSSKEKTEEYEPSGHSFPQLSLDDLTKSPSYDDV